MLCKVLMVALLLQVAIPRTIEAVPVGQGVGSPVVNCFLTASNPNGTFLTSVTLWYNGATLVGAQLDWPGKTCTLYSESCCGWSATLIIPTGSQITGIRGSIDGNSYASVIQFLVDDGVTTPTWDKTFGVSSGTSVLLNGPLMGLGGNSGNVFDQIWFLVNTDYCADSLISTTPAQINKVNTLNNIVTPMGVAATKDITFVGKKHTLYGFFASDPCVVNFAETTSPVSNLITLPLVPLSSDTSSITVFSVDPYKVGNNTVTIKPYYSSHPALSANWASAGVVVYYVYIKPVCEYARITPRPFPSTDLAGILNDLNYEPVLLNPLMVQYVMSSEKFNFPAYQYEFENLWGSLVPSEDICKIKYTLTGPAVDYFRFNWDQVGVTFTNTTSTMVLDAAPVAMQTLTIRSAPDNLVWIGTNTLTLDAEYAEDIWNPNWPNAPLLTPRQLASTFTFNSIVMPRCDLDSYDVSLNIGQTSTSGYLSLDFAFAYSPPSCDYYQIYYVTVDGNSVLPSWLTLDYNLPVGPPHLIVNPTSSADWGTFRIQITGVLNNLPPRFSANDIVFDLSINANPCFDTKISGTIANMYYRIKKLNPNIVLQDFADFTDSVGTCGGLTYQLIGHNSVTPDWAATTMSVSTTNPADVGTHTMIVLVTLTDYPSLKKTVWKTVYFNVTIDSECLHTSIDWKDPELRHLVFSNAVSFQLTLYDVYSESVADLAFCGPKTYTLVSKTGPDPSVLAWDGVDTFSLEGLAISDCGWYKAVFKVTLDWYPDFPASSTTLTGEVVPDCSLSQISITTPLVFATIPLSSWSQSFNLQDGFAHSYESYYYDYHWGQTTKSFYCDPLAFTLDSSVDYLAIDTADVLSLQSTSFSPLGIHEHTVTAYLQNFPSNSILIKFSVEIIDCSISALYADSSYDPGTPHYRVDLLFTGTYVLGQDGLKSFPFTFEDFEMQTGDSVCMSVYTTLYSLYVDDVLVTPLNAAKFPWLIFSEDVAQFAILSGDNADAKNYYTIKVEGRLQTFPAEILARTIVQFEINLQGNPCLNALIQPQPISDWQIILDLVTPETLFKELPDFPYKLPAGAGSDTDCGARLYTLTEAAPKGIEWFQLDTGTLELSIQPANSLLLGVNIFYLKVAFAKFPGLKNAVIVPFKVEILNKCEQVVFTLTNGLIPLIFHQVGEDVVKHGIQLTDGYSTPARSVEQICGPIVLTISPAYLEYNGTSVALAISQSGTSGVIIRLEGKDWIDDHFFYRRLTADMLFFEQKGSFHMSFELYPNVQQSFAFTYYVAPRCRTSFLQQFLRPQQLYTSFGGLEYGITYSTYFIGDPETKFGLAEIVSELDFAGKKYGFDTKCGKTVPVLREIVTKTGSPSGELLIDRQSTPTIYKTKKNSKPFVTVKDEKLVVSTNEPSLADYSEYHFMVHYELEKWPVKDYPHASVYDGFTTVKLFTEPLTTNHPPVLWIDMPCKDISCVVESEVCTILFGAEDPDEDKILFGIDPIETSGCGECWNYNSVRQEKEDWWSISKQEWIITANPSKQIVGASLFFVLYVTDGKSRRVQTTFTIHATDSAIDWCAPAATGVLNITATTDNSTATTMQQNFTISEVMKRLSFLFKSGLVFDEKSPEFAQIMKQLDEIPYPLPIVVSFNATGFVRIRFSKPILMPSASSLADFAEIIMEKEFLQLFLVETEFNQFIKGEALFNRTLFAGVQNKTIAKQRLLSEKSLATDNLDGPKQFNWTIAFLEDQYMGIQLQFNDSAFLSMMTLDKLYFNYSQPQQFLVYAFTGVSPDSSFQQLARVPKQLTLGMAVFQQQSTDSMSLLAKLLAILNGGLTMALGGSLQNLWGAISSLQITIHLPLNNLVFPSNVNAMFQALIGVVTFDVLQLLGVVGVDYSFNFTETFPLNDRFDELGYGSQNTFDNFGSINYILGFIILKSFVFAVLQLDIGRGTRLGQRLRRKFTKTGTSAMWIRFCLQLNFDVLLMCLITVLKGEFPNLLELSLTQELQPQDKFVIGYTYFLFAILATVLVLVITVTFTLGRKLAVLKTKAVQQYYHDLLQSVHEKAKQSQVKVASLNDEDNQEQHEISRLESRLSLFAEIFEGVKKDSFAAMMYNIVFLSRRMVIITVAFCLNDFPVFQIALLTMASLGNAVYLASVNPFEDSSVTHLESFNEIGVYFAILHVWILIDPTLSTSTLNDLGFSMIGFCLLFLFCSMVHVSRDSVRLTMKNCKTRVQRFKSRINAWDRDSELCPCKCNHCGKQPPKRAQKAEKDFNLIIVECKAGEDLRLIDSKKKVFGIESTPLSSKQLRYRQGGESLNYDLQPSGKADRLKEWCRLGENFEDLDEETKFLHRNQEDMSSQNCHSFTELLKKPSLFKKQKVSRNFRDLKIQVQPLEVEDELNEIFLESMKRKKNKQIIIDLEEANSEKQDDYEKMSKLLNELL